MIEELFKRKGEGVSEMEREWGIRIIEKRKVSVTVAPPNFIYLCVCLAFKAYIWITISQILMKLGENVEMLVQLIVLKFCKNWFQ